MRALINASLRYGSEEIFVGVASVASRKELKLKTLHAKCEKPISLLKWCASCSTEVDEVVKGWEQIPGSYLPLNEGDLLVLAPVEDKLVTISLFLGTVKGPEARHVEKNYWLTPGVVDLGYWALYQALLAERAIGVGTAVLWGKESPCAITAIKGKGILLSLLFYDAEVAPFDLMPMKPAAAESTQARELVREGLAAATGAKMKRVFSPPERVNAFLAAKMAANAQGKETVLKTVKKALKTTTPKGRVRS